MDEAQDSKQETESLADDFEKSLGEPEHHESGEISPKAEDVDYQKAYKSAKKRLHAQSMNHEREMRDLHARVTELQSKLTAPDQRHLDMSHAHVDGAHLGGADEQIRKAVSLALQHKDLEERKAKEAEMAAHLQKKYKDLYKHLDSLGDRYDDFHETVFGEDTHFTPAMRDYAVTLPKSGKGSAGEVLYKLAKNPEELYRISKLHPADQAEEMSRLSHALAFGGEENKKSHNHLGNIKTNPAHNSSNVITEKTPVSSLRQRMKEGRFK